MLRYVVRLLPLAATLVAALPQSAGPTETKDPDLVNPEPHLYPEFYFKTMGCNPYDEDKARWMPLHDGTSNIGFRSAIPILCDSATVVGPHKAGESATSAFDTSSGRGNVVSTWGQNVLLTLTISSDQDWQWPPMNICKHAMYQFAYTRDGSQPPCYGSGNKDSMLGEFVDESSGLKFHVVATEI